MKKKRLLTDRTNGLEDALSEEMGRQIQEEIDWEVMCELMKISGWTQIKMDWSVRMSESDAHQIKEWCKNNLKGPYRGRGKDWLFVDEKDASMFALRWA